MKWLHSPVHDRPLVIDGTPWEKYNVNGVTVHVKREDLSCPLPGPPFSKVRGLRRKLENVLAESGSVPIAAVDTVHSMAGWGVAYFAHMLGLQSFIFYPLRRGELAGNGVRLFQRRAAALGAVLVPLRAIMGAIIYHWAKRLFDEWTDGKGVMMPVGLKLEESIDATADEVLTTPEHLLSGTWVIPSSSGTISAGVLKGLQKLGATSRVMIHMGYSRSHDKLLGYLRRTSGWDGDLSLVDEKYEYKDAVDNDWIPFPCNKYYDAKSFLWLYDHVSGLEQPICFWNIGGG